LEGCKESHALYARHKNFMLTYRRSDNLEVVGYSDADFAGCVPNKKSMSCYIFTHARGAMSWKSSKQAISASSMMQAKFIACYEATSCMAKEFYSKA
jgi:hypothetical protein